MYLSLTCYHMDHSSLLPSLVYILSPTVTNLAPTISHSLLNCSIPMYSRVLTKLLAHNLVEYNFINQNAYVQVLLSLILQTSFISKFTQVSTFPPLPSMRFFMHLEYSQILLSYFAFHSGILQLSKGFLKYSELRCTLCL